MPIPLEAIDAKTKMGYQYRAFPVALTFNVSIIELAYGLAILMYYWVQKQILNGCFPNLAYRLLERQVLTREQIFSQALEELRHHGFSRRDYEGNANPTESSRWHQLWKEAMERVQILFPELEVKK